MASSASQDHEQLHHDHHQQHPQEQDTWFLSRLSRRSILPRLKHCLFRKTRHPPPDEEEAVVHPPVFCVEDLEVPPPTYQRARANTPSDAEISTLKEQLQTLKHMRVAAFEPFEKTLHRAEIVNLDSWIKQLEGLAEKRAARAAAAAATAAAAIAADEEAAAAAFDPRR